MITIDPTRELDASPRRYIVEAVVRGADEQTVAANRSVLSLPPFMLGLSVARFLKEERVIRPKIIAVGPDDELLAGQEIQVRLKHRQWHSFLQESDFATGKPST